MRFNKYITEETEIVIKVNDYDNQLIKLLRAAQVVGNIGHSASVVIDPDDKEYKQTFFLDGDGSFHIKSLKINGKEYKE